MKIIVSAQPDTKQELLALGLFSDEKATYDEHNEELQQEIDDALKRKHFKLEFGKTLATKISNSAYKRILVVCLGERKEFTAERLRRAMSRIVKYAKAASLKGFTTNVADVSGLEPMVAGTAAAEGLILTDYAFDKYKSVKENGEIESATIQYSNQTKQKAFSDGLTRGRTISEATNYAKDLVNEPAISLTPTALEKEARKIASQYRLKITVLEKKDMEKLGMGALLGVTAGSDQPPKLIILEYNGGGKRKTAIIGKGVTFDSGGYNLKPTGGIEDMKCDMSGAAAVLGTIRSAAELKLKQNIVGVIPTCENMVSGGAFKPGDILKAHNGKTIEILNTDAEGRLILADAISYTEDRYKPDVMIDLATLTGACVVAFGYYVTGMVTNSQELEKDLIDAGNESYDRVWPFPFFEEYQDNMDGDISDLKNMSNKSDQRAGSAITAAVFLGKFVSKAKWAHLDIAATAYLKEPREYLQKYASGAGVRLLTYYFMK